MLAQQRTALANQVRGLLAEYGLITAKGIANVRKILPNVLGNNPHNMSALILTCIAELKSTLEDYDKKVTTCDDKIEALYMTEAFYYVIEFCKNSLTAMVGSIYDVTQWDRAVA
jgi:hypothetical protein